MAPIRIGFIGLSTTGWAVVGLAGPLFDPLLSSLYTLTAVATRSESTAAETAKKYSELTGHPVKAYFGEDGPRAIANDPNVDLIAVSVRVTEHYRSVIHAIEAGKDVFIEWPVGNGLEETLKIAETAKRKGVRVLVGAQTMQGTSFKKVKELISSGAIGKVLSTTAISLSPDEINFWGRNVHSRGVYASEIKNGTTPLNIHVGHLLTALTSILGDFAEVTATGAIVIATSNVLGADGQPTGEIVRKDVHDQVALSGVLRGKDNLPGTFVNIHCRAGMRLTGEHGRGRTPFRWIFDGEDGTIELEVDPVLGDAGVFIATEKRVLLNGEEVTLEADESDRLTNTGKAWLEFAKGEKGHYYHLEDAVKVHRVLDAAAISIAECKKVVL